MKKSTQETQSTQPQKKTRFSKLKIKKQYLIYCNAYYEVKLLKQYNGYALYDSRKGHLHISIKEDYTRIFDNQKDCLIELGVSIHEENMYFYLPLRADKLVRIAKKYRPEKFI